MYLLLVYKLQIEYITYLALLHSKHGTNETNRAYTRVQNLEFTTNIKSKQWLSFAVNAVIGLINFMPFIRQ